MAIVFNAILAVISTLTSIATIGSFIVPLISQRIQYPGSKELEVKRRRSKVLRISSGLILITIAALITIITLTDQSTNTANTSITYPDTKLHTQPDSMVWSPDSTQIATADVYSGNIKIWDVATGKTLVTYQPPSTQVSSLAWSPDGKYIAADVNGALYILQVDTKMLHRVFVLNTFSLPPGSDIIAWSPDGTQIAVASADDNDVRVWNVVAGHIEVGRAAQVYSHHTKTVISVSWSPDGRFIASASLDNTIQLWKPDKGDIPYRTIVFDSIKDGLLQNSRMQTYLSNIAWSPDGQSLAIENSKGMLSTWDLAGKKLFSVATEQGYQEDPSASIIAWSPDSQFIAIGAYDQSSDEGKIVLVDSHVGKILQSFSYDSPSFPQYALAWSPDQAYIAATSATPFSGGVVIYPSDKDDHFVYRPQPQQNQSEPWLWIILKGESVLLGASLGIITLYKALEKPRLYYLPRSKRQKKLLQLKNVFLHIPSWLIGSVFIIILFNTMNSIPFVITALLMGCTACEVIILQRYLQPYFLNLRNYLRVKPIIKAGDVYARQKKYHLAISQYDQALVLLPGYVPAYIGRGHAYLSLGEYQWALNDINQALHLAPQRIGLYEARGDANYKLKEYEQALEDYNKAVDVLIESAGKARLYFNRGYVQIRLKNASQARVDFLKSAALNQTTVNSAWMAVWTSLGKKRVDKETAEQLAEHLKKIADRNPQLYPARLCSGVSLALRENVKSALKEIEQAIAQSPQLEDAYFWKGLLLAYYYQGKSHADEVVESIERAIHGGLPPILLTPLYWLEKDTPVFFTQRIQPLLQKHLG